jgi:D-lactate dehydrogenase
MRIGIFEAEEWEAAACHSLTAEHSLTCASVPLDLGEAGEHADLEVVSTFIRSRLDAAILSRLPRLRLIATRSTGYDHIDLAYCRSAGIAVCNVPDYGDPTVAEHAFALLLTVSRRIVEAAARTRRGDFSMEGLRGFDLAGRTLGVIGAGRIGRRVIRIARGFAMQVLAFDTRPEPQAAAELGFSYAELPELLRRADVISLHVPGSTETRDLLSDAQFALMKPGAVLINTARGGVVNTPALVRALSSGRLAGAGLDVVADEPLLREESEIFRLGRDLAVEELRSLVATNTMLKLPHVVITPHVAYDTEEAVHRIIAVTLRNIEAFAAGTPQNLVSAPT